MPVGRVGVLGDERLRVHRQTDRVNGEGFSMIELESLCACVLRPGELFGPKPCKARALSTTRFS